MPNKVLKNYAKESGKSLKEVEEAWEQAKKESSKFHKEQDEQYWGYVNLRTRQIIGLENIKNKKKS